MLLTGLAGCGQTSSDSAPGLGSRASVGRPPSSKQSPLSGNNPLTQVALVATPVPLVLGNNTGAASGNGTVPGGDSPQAVPVPSSMPAEPVGTPIVPGWMAKELDSPDIATRLHALEVWAQSAPPGAVDPLIQALDDTDERVQAWTMELIKQDMARDSEVEKYGKGVRNKAKG